MRDLRLVGHQTRYDLLALVRNPQSRFFTFALPVIFLVLFVSVLGNGDIHVDGGKVHQSTYYVPHIAAFGIIGTAMVSLLVTVVTQREEGILKRRRSAPVPAWVIIAGRTATMLLVTIAIVVLLFLIGWIAYGVTLPSGTLFAAAVTVLLGAVVFATLAYAISSFVGSTDAALPVAQVASLPFYFISGIFFPQDAIPHWLLSVADWFPFRPLATALFDTFNPHTHGMGFDWAELGTLAAWGAGAVLIAAARFRWSPRHSS
jgi:ABC-2 type transport system permease protein